MCFVVRLLRAGAATSLPIDRDHPSEQRIPTDESPQFSRLADEGCDEGRDEGNDEGRELGQLVSMEIAHPGLILALVSGLMTAAYLGRHETLACYPGDPSRP